MTATPKNQLVDLTHAELLEKAFLANEGEFAANGAFVVKTGERTGRSPNDRFIVKEATTEAKIDWGKVNRPVSETVFEALWDKAEQYLLQRKQYYVSHLEVGADPVHGLPIVVRTETAWQQLFARNLFIIPESWNQQEKTPWQIINVPGLACDPAVDGTNSDGAVMINFKLKKVLLVGMRYAGEMKKAMFSVQNFLLPEHKILPMHCSSNVGKTAVLLYSLVYRELVKQHYPLILNDSLLVTMSTAGQKVAYLTLKAVVTLNVSIFLKKKSRLSGMLLNSVLYWKT